MDEVDIAIIGGGIAGASVCYHLTEDFDVEDVVLIERGQLGSGTTSKATGGVRTVFTDPQNRAMSRHGVSFYADFDDHVGGTVDFRQDGYLYLYRTADEERDWERRIRDLTTHDVHAEFIDPTDVVDHVPGLDPTAIRGGVFAAECGFVDPHRVVQGFCTAARRNGATIRTSTAVTDIEVNDGTVHAIRTDSGSLAVNTLVNTAGPWARQLCAHVGVELPVELMCRRVVVTTPGATAADTGPYVVDTSLNVSFRAEPEGAIHISDKHLDIMDIDDPDRYQNVGVDLAETTAILDRFADLVPAVIDHGIENSWSGVRVLTPDAHPIIDETAVENLYVATGFAGHGIMHGPSVGAALAELIMTGTTDVIDIDQFAIDRFADGQTTAEEMEH